MQKFRKSLAAIACLIVGVASFAMSYVALRDVAVELGAVPPHLGWLVPIVIDGGIICGSAVLWSASKEQKHRPKFPFLFVGAMVIMSVIVNVAHAGDSTLAKVIAGLPPLILLGTLELVAEQGRKDREEQAAKEAEEAAALKEAAEEKKANLLAERQKEEDAKADELRQLKETLEAAELALKEVRQEKELMIPTQTGEKQVEKKAPVKRAPRTSATASRTSTTSSSTPVKRTTKTSSPEVKATKVSPLQAVAMKESKVEASTVIPEAKSEAKKPAARAARKAPATTRPLRVSAMAPEEG